MKLKRMLPCFAAMAAAGILHAPDAQSQEVLSLVTCGGKLDNDDTCAVYKSSTVPGRLVKTVVSKSYSSIPAGHNGMVQASASARAEYGAIDIEAMQRKESSFGCFVGGQNASDMQAEGQFTDSVSINSTTLPMGAPVDVRIVTDVAHGMSLKKTGQLIDGDIFSFTGLQVNVQVYGAGIGQTEDGCAELGDMPTLCAVENIAPGQSKRFSIPFQARIGDSFALFVSGYAVALSGVYPWRADEECVGLVTKKSEEGVRRGTLRTYISLQNPNASLTSASGHLYQR